MRQIIDFETHFYTKKFVDFLEKHSSYPFYEKLKNGDRHMHYAPNVFATHAQNFIDRLVDVHQERIKMMDDAQVACQILSLSEPSVGWIRDADLASEVAHVTNDTLYEITQSHPERFKGFATVAPQAVSTGVKELERCVEKLGFVGWLTHSNYGTDRYLDDQCYWPLLEAAESLGVPIYIHPIIPAMPAFYKYGFALAGASLGFQFETALCLMRMIFGGVFDRYPNLKIIIGHLGETLPFLIERLDFTFVKEWFSKEDRPNIERIPSQVLKENVYVTISGRYYEPALRLSMETLGKDKVLFGSDYPYEQISESVDFIEKCSMNQEEKEGIFYKNGKALLGI